MAKYYLIVAAIIVALLCTGAYLWHDGAVNAINALGPIPANAQNAIGNATVNGFKITPQMTAASSSSQCVLQQTTFCDNNEPNQFVCVNKSYSSNVSAQYKKIYTGRAEACPEFMLAGRISCVVSEGYCMVTDNRTS